MLTNTLEPLATARAVTAEALGDVDPNPMSVTLAGESAALLLSEISAVWMPFVVGRNATVKAHVCWTGTAALRHVPPSTWNGSVVVIASSLSGSVPVLLTVIVSGCDAPPVGTFPKSYLVWLSTSSATGGGPAARPVPRRATVCGEPEVLLSMIRLPVAAPGAAGAKRTVSAHTCAGAITAPSQALSATKGPCVRRVPRRKVPRPVLVTLIVCGPLLLPTVTSPKSWPAGVTVAVGTMPVPLSAIVGAAPLALLGMVTVPAFDPVSVGRKVAVNVHESPAAIEAESQVLLTANWPVAETVPITNAMVPVFVIVKDCAALVVPVACSPKSWLAVLRAIEGEPPVPLSVTVEGEPAASLGIVMVPLLAPVLAGLKVAVNEQVPPGTSFTPLQLPVIPNWPLTLRLCRLRSEVPELVIVRVTGLLVVPTLWRPKVCVVLLNDTTGSTPWPCRPTVICEPLLGMVMDPDFAPALVGVKLAANTQVPPEVIAAPLHAVLTANPLPALTVPMVSVPVPVLRIVTDCVGLVVPTRWLPNDRLLGVALADTVTPVPLRVIEWGAPLPLLGMVMAADAGPLIVGRKLALIVHQAPGWRLAFLHPVSIEKGAVVLGVPITSVPVPEFVTVKD